MVLGSVTVVTPVVLVIFLQALWLQEVMVITVVLISVSVTSSTGAADDSGAVVVDSVDTASLEDRVVSVNGQ